MRLVPALLIATQVACTHTLLPPQPPGSVQGPDTTRCRELDDQRIAWSGVEDALLVLGGAGGLSSLAVDDSNARLGVAIGALVSLAASRYAKARTTATTESLARTCLAPRPPEAVSSRACAAAEARLQALDCRRADGGPRWTTPQGEAFAAVCERRAVAGADMRPDCIAAVQTCAEVDTAALTPQGAPCSHPAPSPPRSPPS